MKTEKCMDCGQETELRQAPSGTMLPRCDPCNRKRWSEARKQEKRLGVKTIFEPGEMNPLDDPWG